ncbi:hypothetical protein [Celeribacter arenosi]|uniref:hypothetical protein n=1 Tax=Celeribacter arenosi TaxID=792649 RepID=UPI0031D83F26
MSDEYLCAIEDYGQQSSEFLGVFDAELKRLHTLRPFGSSGIRKAQPVDGVIYTFPHLANSVKDGTPIALIDAESGRELARERSFVLPEQIVHLPRNGMIAVIGGLAEVEFRDARTLTLVWTCRPRVVIDPSGTIEPVPNDCIVSKAPRGAIKPLHSLAEGPDGIVRMPLTSPHITGVFEINLATRRFQLVPLDPGPDDLGFNGGFTSISPDGRWGIRESVKLQLEPYERPQSKYGKWFLVSRFFEIWDLLGHRKQADITTAPQPVLVYDRSREEALSYYGSLRSGDGPRGLWGLIGISRKKKLRHGDEDNRHKQRKTLIGERQRFHWEPDSKGVWLVRRYSMMRVDLDGAAGPLIFPDHGLGDAQRAALQGRQEGVDLGVGEVHHHGTGCELIRSVTKPRPDMVRFDFYNRIQDLPLPYSHSDANGPVHSFPKLKARDIEAQLRALIPVKGWTQSGVDDALVDLEARINAGLENLASGNGLTFIFKLRGTFLDEWTFFERLNKKGLVNVSLLRDLVTAWCDAQGDKQWYFTSDETRAAGPMSGALACLAQNDDRCHDLLRRYCLTRDGEHEIYARDTVLLGFIKRSRLTDLDTLRLAIFFVLLREQDGQFSVENGKVVYPWGELGILPAARSFMKPDDFAKVVTDEAAHWGRRAEVIVSEINGLVDMLNVSDPWDAKVHSALRS